MSDTPQVDALDFGDQSRFPGPGYGDLWELARNLERENAALREALERFAKEWRFLIDIGQLADHGELAQAEAALAGNPCNKSDPSVGPELGPDDKLPCAVATDGGPSFGEGVRLRLLLDYLARRVTYNNEPTPNAPQRPECRVDRAGFKCHRFTCLMSNECQAETLGLLPPPDSGALERNKALEEAAYLIDTAVLERSPETKDLDPDDKLYFEVCGELAKRIRALKRPADLPAQPRYDRHFDVNERRGVSE